MLIKRLEIRNYRKVKQADIDFHGPGLQVIQGPNKSGKSTIAQSIALSLEGPKAFNPGVITMGEEQAEIITYTDDGLQIKTVIKDSMKQTVSRFDETAKKYVAVSGGVRSFLDSVRSGLELPWAMRDLTDAKIIEILKERTGVSQRIAEIDAAIKDKETARRDVGRDKTKMGQLTPVKPAKHPEPIDNIQAERNTAKEYLEWNREQFSAVSEHLRKKCLFNCIEDIEAFKEEVEQARLAIIQCLAAKQNRLGREYTQKDLDRLENEFTQWVNAEQAAKGYDIYQEKVKVMDELTTRYEALTTEIEGLREERKKTLSDMRLGVKGLEIGEDNFLYHNGIVRGITDSNKIGNWSTAESVQVFFQIAVRFSGSMKVLIVDNAESLDDETTEAISKWAEKAEYLVILLKVASIPEALEDGIIYIKEGEILTA
jgi:DNA repair exonuclease SbcCD ATPase subunit